MTGDRHSLTASELRGIVADALEGAAKALRKGTSSPARPESNAPISRDGRNAGHPLTMSVAEAAVLLGVSRATMYEMVAQGQVPNIKLGRRRLIPVVALQSWMEATTDRR